ncbi:thioesterase family protein [Streptomyces sp. H27-H1]|uniref:acyl-CoA thioesterase n=1 Tax=Streptomyces sp. H27-H1 TaxID=2996461 RepID=UPI002270ABBB|nr:thioesterase family protein [Streptomyces sp. H27-H1]MCY0931503.1 thioesterase family protein [Streptomyces sp. H27-H1]
MPRFTYLCPIRWSDMDANNHVNNAVYPRYLEEARMNMFKELVPSDPGERLAKNFFLSEQWMKFSRPLVYSTTPVSIEAWVTDLKGVAFELAYEIKDVGGLYVAATSRMAGYDSVAGRVRRFDEAERAVLSGFLDER